jgi:tetratricopeptide (TPR) repeat protein
VQIGTAASSPVQIADRKAGAFRIALGTQIVSQLPLLQVSAIELPLADEEAGQAVIRTYLRGHQVSQPPEEFRQAEAAFARANDANPSPYLEARRLFCRGRWLTFQRRYDAAIDALEQAIGIDPQAAYSYNALGIAYLEAARLPEAARAFRDAIRLAPGWIYPMHNLALTYTQGGAWDAAIRQYRAAIALQPEYGTLHHNLAAVYHQIGRYNDAEAEYRQALRDPVAGTRGRIGIAVLRATGRNRGAAEMDYNAVIQAGDAPVEALYNLGVLYFEWGRTDRAIEALERATRANSTFVFARLELARAYNRAGRYDDAARQYLTVASGGTPGGAISMLMAENEGDRLLSLSRRSDALDKYGEALRLSASEDDRDRIQRKIRRNAKRTT